MPSHSVNPSSVMPPDSHSTPSSLDANAPLVNCFTLENADAIRAAQVAKSLRADYHSVTNPQFLRDASILVGELPWALKSAINSFRLLETSAVFHMRGYPFDPASLPPTPAKWNQLDRTFSTPEDFLFFLLASSLGDVFALGHLQGGNIIQDVFPVDADLGEQLSGGTVELQMHTEDPWMVSMPDYLGLFCNRNPDAVGTTLSRLPPTALTPELQEILQRCVYSIKPDGSHPKGSVLRSLVDSTRPDPYLRYDDVEFIEIDRLQADEREAYMELCRIMRANATSVALAPGECIFLDNFRCVHGRNPYKARRDGTDRWLRKTFVTRDLRTSRGLRSAPEDRVIRFPKPQS